MDRMIPLSRPPLAVRLVWSRTRWGRERTMKLDSLRSLHRGSGGAAALFLLVPAVAEGGEVAVKNPPAPVVEAPVVEDDPWWKFSIDSRLRYEYADMDGRDDSWALTLRNRAGLLLGPWEGFSAFAEYEGTLTADRDSCQAASVHGLGQNKTIIADPESHELNRAWLRYRYAPWSSDLKVGRQRIILNNARFVGNVGWRQNEQTFDAVGLTNTSFDNLTLYYGYVNRANRIFGSGDIGTRRRRTSRARRTSSTPSTTSTNVSP